MRERGIFNDSFNVPKMVIVLFALFIDNINNEGDAFVSFIVLICQLK